MINAQDHYVSWVLLVDGLDEAREHLEKLTEQMHKDGSIDEAEFAVYLGHIYAHLNRVWHSRNITVDISKEQWDSNSQFPRDLDPVG